MRLISGQDLKSALLNAYACLSNEKSKIDSLNVFPVPDGDTGTNMYLTFSSGINAINDIKSDSVGQVMKTFSRGLLMGARGNSGVILSQIFRGLAKTFEGLESVSIHDLVVGLVEGRETAYRAVINPVEGTILTVISDIALEATKLKESQDVDHLLRKLILAGEKSLENTPNILPILKEAGVVDSGGYGLMIIFKGVSDYFFGNITEMKENFHVFDNVSVVDAETEFGYCTEFIVELDSEKMVKNRFSEEKLKQQLSKIGDSLVIVHDDDIVKVHVHTLVPGEALNLGQMYGEFIKLKIENMTLQHEEIIKGSHGKKEKYAIIAVSPGEGISKLFVENGATNIIDGGQTMNPSTSDFVSMINELNAENILILPNNSNIILAASQAKELVESSGNIKVGVIPTKSVISGLAALSFYNSDETVENNVVEMQVAYEDIAYGEVTYAVRDTTINDVVIKSGEYIAISGKEIVKSVLTKNEALFSLIDELIDEEKSVITIIVGNDVTNDEEKLMINKLENEYSDFEIEIHRGKQEVYSYFIGIE